jgi:hypothetical protein
MTEFTLYSTPSNNHGCRGYEVTVLPITGRLGLVIKGESCSSCWQTGCDDASSPVHLGTVVELPPWANLGWSDECPVFVNSAWRTTIQRYRAANSYQMDWAAASTECGYSHNELVDDRRDPRPDCTIVGPADLLTTNEELVPLFAACADMRYKKDGAFKAFKLAFDTLNEQRDCFDTTD